MVGLLHRIIQFFTGWTSRNKDAAEETALETNLRQAVDEMESELNTAIQASAEAMRHLNRMQASYREHEAQSAEWKQKALNALNAGDEMSAKQALVRKKAYDKQMASAAVDLESAAEVQAKIEAEVNRIRAEILAAKRRAETLIARQRTAKAQKTAVRILTDGSKEDRALDSLERLEDRVARDEAIAKAVTRVHSDLADKGGAPLKIAFDSPDATDFDAELEALKAELKAKQST